MSRHRRIGGLLLRCALVVLVLVCGLVQSSGYAATGSSSVGVSVLSATSIDTGACRAGLSFPAMPVSTTSIAPTCTVSFGSSNDTARLIAHQRDGTGDAMTRHSASWTVRRGLGSYYGTTQSPDGARLWAAGQAAISGQPAPLLTSTDGGTTWTNQTPCASETRIRNVVALSATTAYSLGARICRTTDGGSTWSGVTAPGTGALSDLDEAGDGTLWASGATGSTRMLRSTDGGTTWTNHPLPRADSIASIVALSASTAIAVGRNYVPTTTIFAVWRTTDGGATWTDTTLGTVGSLATGPGAIERSPGGTLLIASYTSNGIFRSTDNGATWTAHDASQRNLTVQWVSGTTWVAAGSTTGRRSTDDGATWTSIPSFPTQGAPTMWGTSEAVGGTLVMSGSSETLLRSTDSGATFTEVTPPRLEFEDVTHLGDRRFVTVGGAGIAYYSTNGGATVTAGTTGTSARLLGVEADHGRAIAVGASGTALVSDDGGATWQARSSGTAVTLYDIDRASETGALIAVGSTGVIRRSTDRGDTWSAVNSPTATNLTEVAVSPQGDQIWVANTANGTLWRSTDSGASWTLQNTGEAEPIWSLDVSATGVLLATHAPRPDYLSRTLRSADGGATWTIVNVPSSNAYQVAFSSPQQAWILVAGGVVLESTDGGLTFSSATAGSTGVSTNPNAMGIGDGNSVVVVGAGEMIITTEPSTQVPDVGDAGANLASGGSAFGVCVEGASGTATNPWPVVGTCVAATAGHWNPLPPLASDPGSTVATTASTASGSVDLRFGLRAGATQLAGTYRADVTFEVLAPG